MFLNNLNLIPKNQFLLVWKNTEHYHFSLHQYFFNKRYNVVLNNPKTTDYTRKLQEAITK